MSKYDELRLKFLKDHEKADEMVFKLNDDFITPVKAIYLAPDPEVDYDELDTLIEEINQTIEE